MGIGIRLRTVAEQVDLVSLSTLSFNLELFFKDNLVGFFESFLKSQTREECCSERRLENGSQKKQMSKQRRRGIKLSKNQVKEGSIDLFVSKRSGRSKGHQYPQHHRRFPELKVFLQEGLHSQSKFVGFSKFYKKSKKHKKSKKKVKISYNKLKSLDKFNQSVPTKQ